MPTLIIKPQAQADLDSIFDYIAQDSVQHAEHFLRLFYEKFLLLQQMPETGTTRPDLALGIRAFPFRHYVIFYQITETGLDIVRILHGARDIPNLFGEGTE